MIYLLVSTSIQDTVLNQRIFQQLNIARTNPSSYADKVKTQMDRFVNDTHYRITDNMYMQTWQGKKVWQQAYDYLKNKAPISALTYSACLQRAAMDLARDANANGHTGSDGSSMRTRIQRYCTWTVTIGQNIAYGSNNPQQIVLQLIIDDGVPSRGHRANIYNQRFHQVGIDNQVHATWGYNTVFDFAGSTTALARRHKHK